MTARPWQAHVDAEVLESYALGKLSESSLAAVEEHLLVCAQCAERLKQTDEFIAALRESESRPRLVEVTTLRSAPGKDLSEPRDRALP